MRRIYESDALHRDDDEAHSPRERKRSRSIQAMRSVPSTTLSNLFAPKRLRHASVLLDVTTPRERYDAGTQIPFTVTMKNRLPFPITITTESPVVWEWSVDGDVEASKVSLRNPPAESGRFEFERGERKRFTKRWDQMFRVAEHEWERATPGEYVLGAAINVSDPAGSGLTAETTVEIR